MSHHMLTLMLAYSLVSYQMLCTWVGVVFVKLVLVFAVAPILIAATHGQAVAAARQDAAKLPEYDRVYMRYLWWDRSWKDYVLLTKVTQAIISQGASFPEPVVVCQQLMRIDLRHSGHKKFLLVWENFRGIDFAFHNKRKYFEDATYTTYYPPGSYTVGTDTKWFEGSAVEEKIKQGQINDEPAVWANPVVEIKPGLSAKAYDELRKLLSTEVPILWGPFWMVRVQRQIDINNTKNGVGYFDWFGIKTRNDYFDLLILNDKAAKQRKFFWGGYVKKSGVSQQERLIVILGAGSGKVFGTLDVFTQKDDGQVLRNLRDSELKHNAEEWIGRKSDGLWLNGLFDNKGLLQDTAPDKIGTDTSTLNKSLDRRIGPDTCIHCHGVLGRNYIIPYDDFLRKNIVRGKAVLKDIYQDVELELSDQYLRNIDLIMKQEREGYADAVARLTRDPNNPKDPGMTVAQFAAWYRDAYYSYVEPKGGVGPELAAQYIGVRKEEMVNNLNLVNRTRGNSDLLTVSYIFDPPEGINMLAFEDSYQYLLLTSYGLRIPELLVKTKGFSSKVPAKEGK